MFALSEWRQESGGGDVGSGDAGHLHGESEGVVARNERRFAWDGSLSQWNGSRWLGL